mgnify:CR=1 FL=1
MEVLSKLLTSTWAALATALLAIVIFVLNPSPIETLQLKTFDYLIDSLESKNSDEIILVEFGEKSVQKYGQWPFKRDQYANLIAQLYAHNAGLVVWNIMMPENDRLGGDKALADTLKDYPVILANTPSQTPKNQAKKPGSAIIGSEHIDTILNYPGVIANIPALETNAVGVGITNTLPEVDGVNRRMPLLVTVDGKLYLHPLQCCSIDQP